MLKFKDLTNILDLLGQKMNLGCLTTISDVSGNWDSE